MRNDYKRWLEEQQYAEGTVTAQLHRAGRVEECYGDLVEHYNTDRMESVITELRYSANDERHNKPNPSKIEFNGNIKNNLASYRNATERYRRFLDESGDEVFTPDTNETVYSSPEKETAANLFGLERDMQRVLRQSINELEEGLVIIDEGAERSVQAGFIDITAKDKNGAIVVIELKAGKARKDAVGQILSYMGDISEEEPDTEVRGILVASDFDVKVTSASKVISTLELKKYSISFNFEDGKV